MSRDSDAAEPRGGSRARGLFERFPHGLVLVGERGRVLSLNGRARELLALDERAAEPGALTCCEIVCDPVGAVSCLTERLLATGEPPGDVELRTAGGEVALVSGARVDAEDVRVLFQLRPAGSPRGGEPARRAPRRPSPRVHTLGVTRVEVGGEPLAGDWLGQRAGLLLKYLVAQRRRVAPSEQIAEALWPDAAAPEALASLRHYVHVLRKKLEPDRARRSASFVQTHRGGYRLDPERIWIDAEELEQRAREGLLLFADGELEPAAAILEDAVALHRGEFLADGPDAEWALQERERLHDLAARAYAALVEIELATGELDAAAEHARRLADMEPLDTDIQRQLIEICLRQGRRSDAARRYELLRTRTLRELGAEPDFALSDLTG